MLKDFSTIGKPLNKKEQQAIKGGIWDSLSKCLAECDGICAMGFGGRWACFE